MKHPIFISSLFLLLIQQNETILPANLKEKNGIGSVLSAAEGDVTITSSYLTDANGYNYGAVFYIHNTTNYTVGVKWWFEGSSNVRFSPESSGRMALPAKTTGVLLTTCTSADHSKAWNSGTPKYDWAPAVNDEKNQ